jgi:hypothetical protein
MVSNYLFISIYIIDIIIYQTLSFLTLRIIFIIFIYKIIYILAVSAYPYFLKLLYHHIDISVSAYPYPISVSRGGGPFWSLATRKKGSDCFVALWRFTERK